MISEGFVMDSANTCVFYEGKLWPAIYIAVAVNMNLALFKDDEPVNYEKLARQAREEAYDIMWSAKHQDYSYEDFLVIATVIVRNTISRHKFFKGWHLNGSNTGDRSNVIINTISSITLDR
jgi:hypothetical protein